ncbi:hypothetical protein RVD_128 [viral metagenome]
MSLFTKTLSLMERNISSRDSRYKLTSWHPALLVTPEQLTNTSVDDLLILHPTSTFCIPEQEALSRSHALHVDMRYRLTANHRTSVDHEFIVGRQWKAYGNHTQAEFFEGGDENTTTLSVQPAFAGLLSSQKDKAYLDALSAIGRQFQSTPQTAITPCAKKAAHLIEQGEINLTRLAYRFAAMYVASLVCKAERISCDLDQARESVNIQRLDGLTVFERMLTRAMQGDNVFYYEPQHYTPGTETALQLVAIALGDITYSPNVRRVLGPTLTNFWPSLGPDPTLLYLSDMREENFGLGTLTEVDVLTAACAVLGMYDVLPVFHTAVHEIMAFSTSTADHRSFLGLDCVAFRLPKFHCAPLAAGILAKQTRTAVVDGFSVPHMDIQLLASRAVEKRLTMELTVRTALVYSGGSNFLAGNVLPSPMVRNIINQLRPTRGAPAIIRAAAAIASNTVGTRTFGPMLGSVVLAPTSNFDEALGMAITATCHTDSVQWEEMALWAKSLPEGNALSAMVTPLSFDPMSISTNIYYRPELTQVSISSQQAMYSLLSPGLAVAAPRTYWYTADSRNQLHPNDIIEQATPVMSYRGVLPDMLFLPFSSGEGIVSMPLVQFSSTTQVLALANRAKRHSEYTWYVDLVDDTYLSIADILNEATPAPPPAPEPSGTSLPTMVGDYSSGGENSSSSSSSNGGDDGSESSASEDTNLNMPADATRLKFRENLDEFIDYYHAEIEPPKWMKNLQHGLSDATMGEEEMQRKRSLRDVHSIAVAWDPVNLLTHLHMDKRCSYMDGIAKIMEACADHASPIPQCSDEFRDYAQRARHISASLAHNPGLTVDEYNTVQTQLHQLRRKAAQAQLDKVTRDKRNMGKKARRDPRRVLQADEDISAAQSALQLLQKVELISSEASTDDILNALRTGKARSSLTTFDRDAAAKKAALAAEAERQAQELLSRIDPEILRSFKACGMSREDLVQDGYPITEEQWDAIDLEGVEDEATRLGPIRDDPLPDIDQLDKDIADQAREEEFRTAARALLGNREEDEWDTPPDLVQKLRNARIDVPNNIRELLSSEDRSALEQPLPPQPDDATQGPMSEQEASDFHEALQQPQGGPTVPGASAAGSSPPSAPDIRTLQFNLESPPGN